MSKSIQIKSTFCILGVLFLLGSFLACGGEEDERPRPTTRTYESIELRELVDVDEGTFDVQWLESTIVVEEEVVLAEIEDLDPLDGVYRVEVDSALLAGLEAGTIVFWPQVGVFEILSLNEVEGVVEIATRWARLRDAAESAEIRFRHALVAGETGRAVGVQPKVPALEEDILEEESALIRQGLWPEDLPLQLSEDGASYSGEAGGLDYEVNVGRSSVGMSFTSQTEDTTVSVSGTVRGAQAQGLVLMHPEADDPSVVLEFNDLEVEVQASLAVRGASGTVNVNPPAVVRFPFVVGGFPAYVEMALRFQIRSSISQADNIMTTSAGFRLGGRVVLARNDDGSFGAEGEITRLDIQAPEMTFDLSVTSGVAIDIDVPRISFGIGRPGLASASIFGTHSVELVANTTINPSAGEYCAQISSGGAILAGGELGFFGWTIGGGVPIYVRDGETSRSGGACN